MRTAGALNNATEGLINSASANNTLLLDRFEVNSTEMGGDIDRTFVHQHLLSGFSR
jgi:hypothetical protein